MAIVSRVNRGFLLSRSTSFYRGIFAARLWSSRYSRSNLAFQQLHAFHGRSARSPQSVLGVSLHASRGTIKARFRELAKQMHPDTSDAPDAPEKMAELIQAYDALMDDDLAGRIWGNGLAFTCEIYSIDEIRAGNLFDVHALRVLLENFEHNSSPGEDEVKQTLDASCIALDIDRSHEMLKGTVATSLDDSVLDLKRALQIEYGEEWGLSDRQKNRQGLAMGWEVVYNGSALSYHLFLHDYGIAHRDIIHVIVRRNEG